MWVWGWVEHRITSIAAASGVTGGGGATTAFSGIWGAGGGRWNVGVAIGVTAMAGIALAATIVISSRRGTLKSPWSRRKRKKPLTRRQWESMFTADGKLLDGGVKFLKKVRSGGVEHDIRLIVWPFLLGLYDLNSSEAERSATRIEKRKDYMKLRSCQLVPKPSAASDDKVMNITRESKEERSDFSDTFEPCLSTDNKLGLSSPNNGEHFADNEPPLVDKVSNFYTNTIDTDEKSVVTNVANSEVNVDPPSSESSVDEGAESLEFPVTLDDEDITVSPMEDDTVDGMDETDAPMEDDGQFPRMDSVENSIRANRKHEDCITWHRIIRLDAIRANDEWIPYSPRQAQVSLDEARQRAEAVGLKDYEHLDACRMYHAARLVGILDAYVVYDQEVGYCQGMSDLLSPIVAIIEEDYEAFWCFVGFMRKARHNFRLDEVGIRRQLNIVAKIIKSKDSHLYRHLQKLQAEDCFFVYRMVVVLFRRELDFGQTMNLWEALWADQAALRAGFNKSGWGKIRMRAPPTEDLLLYAIAASVLQKRKLIIESFSSLEEIMKECNNMAGTLDVWKLLDDAHDLVVSVHDKIL